MSDVAIGPTRGNYSKLTYNDSRTVSGTAFPTQEQSNVGDIEWTLDNAGTNGLKAFKFVKVASASANVVAGNLVWYTDSGYTTVDTRHGQAIGVLNSPAGIAQSSITAGNFGWIQVVGVTTTITMKAGTTIAVGDAVIGSTTDLLVDKVAANTAPTNKIIGWCTVADAVGGHTFTAQLCCL